MQLHGWKVNGDVILGYHARDRDLELEAVREAVRCFASGEQPPRGYIPVPRVLEGAKPQLVSATDTEAYFKRRVFETWQELWAHFKGVKLKAKAKRQGKGVRS